MAFTNDIYHNQNASQRQALSACGRDYLDARPVRGVRRGGGVEEMHVAVRVAASAQQ